MKKITYFVIALLFLFNNVNIYARAADTPKQTNTFNQWRFGLGLGLEFHDMEAKAKDNLFPLMENFQSDRSHTKKKLQFAPSVEFGVTAFNAYYLGLLFSWHYLDAKTLSRTPFKDTTHFVNEFKMHHYFDILAKPGYKLTPKAMIYGLVGPSIAKWSHTSNRFKDGVQDDSFKISKTSVGLGVGLGFEYVLQKKYAFGVDYIYHIHRATTKKQSMNFLDPRGGRTRSGVVSKEVEPSYSTLAIRWSYFF